jgi:DNA polymerase-3 subunit gamma/tau
MTYQVLARKWRPQTFEAVVGQEPVTRTLQNALASGRIAHAYCFTGPRGVGKTTTARLLAKALLCASRRGAEPCGLCPPCQELQAGTAVDVLEIDGASNNSVAEIRTLRDNVKYAPARGKHKVYIIDEVHMLSGAAFNAFLKTLEEPPPHVIFILATTDPKKVPLTVLSRCQRFDFKPIPPEILVESLKRILAGEGVPFDPEALPLLVRAAEGSLRDALSLLDAALAYGGGRLEGEALARLLGTSAPAQIRALVSALVAADAGAALEGIDRAVRDGQDPAGLCREAVEAIRRLLIVKAAPSISLPDLTAAEIAEIKSQGERVSVEELLFILRVLLEADAELRRSPHPRIELEIAAVRAARRPKPAAIETLLERVEEAEARLRQMAVLGGSAAKPVPVQESLLTGMSGDDSPAPVMPARKSVPSAPRGESGSRAGAPKAEGPTLEEGWRRVVDDVMRKKPTLGAVLGQGSPAALTEGTLVVALLGNHFHKDLLADRANREIVNESVQRHIPGATRIEVRTESGKFPDVQEDPAVQAALELFQGEVVAVRPRSPEGGERR